MNRADWISIWVELGESMRPGNEGLEAIIRQTEQANGWFTAAYQWQAIDHIRNNWLQARALEDWLLPYQLPVNVPGRIGLIPAGNIPLVGMHDLLSVMMAGHTALVKPSSKDPFFLPWLRNQLQGIAPEAADRFLLVEKLAEFDAVIATGSDNSSRYFEYYFGKYPHIIRRNRSSAAILDGSETEEQLIALGSDIFTYFGLGCRNVSKLYLPAGYDPSRLLSLWEVFGSVRDHHKYRNNLDYNLTLLLLNNSRHLAADYLILAENEALHAPLATVYYQHYQDEDELRLQLEALAGNLQCVVSVKPGNTIPGTTQQPGLSDYADHVDTLTFLQDI
ncbi:MAG: acyl-CoA reductase [Chitinophagales bacterium]|nr:acyl-CoA reductase [Chitinophagales bacterium]